MDEGSSSDIMFLKTQEKTQRTREDLKKVDSPLLGLAKLTIFPIGAMNITMVLGEGLKYISIEGLLLIVDASSPYHAILGQTKINPNKIAASTAHQKLKCSTSNGIGKVLGRPSHVQRVQCKLSLPTETQRNHRDRDGSNGRRTSSLTSIGVNRGQS